MPTDAGLWRSSLAGAGRRSPGARRKDLAKMGKTVEYRTLETSLNDLESVLNEYAHERFKPIHFLPTEETGSVMVVFSRKQKRRKFGKHDHDEADDEVLED